MIPFVRRARQSGRRSRADQARDVACFRYQPAASWRASASAVSSGCVLNAMAALGAVLWTAFTTISKSGRLFGGSLRPPPITMQS
jgi:hypothetical protein